MTGEVADTQTEIRSDDEPNTLVNAGIGAVVTLLTAPLLPFAAIFGGGTAGYLQRDSVTEGATVGALSGALASLPIFGVGWFVLGVLLLGLAPLGITSIFATVLFVATVGYLVGAGALGGALGAYLRTRS